MTFFALMLAIISPATSNHGSLGRNTTLKRNEGIFAISSNFVASGEVLSFELLANIRTQTLSHEVAGVYISPPSTVAVGTCWIHCQSTFGGRVAEIDRNEVIKRFVIVTADKLSAVSFPREIRIDDGTNAPAHGASGRSGVSDEALMLASVDSESVLRLCI